MYITLPYRLLILVTSLVIYFLMQTNVHAAPLPVDPFFVSATNTAGITGSPTTITANITNSGGLEPIVIDIEIYDSNGTQVKQQHITQTINQNETFPFSMTWTPGQSGDYTVSVGLFSENWSKLYQWKNKVLAFTVTGESGTPMPFSLSFVSASANPEIIRATEETVIQVTVKNTGGAGTGTVDFELTNDGVKKSQEAYEGESFSAGESKTYTFSFIPSPEQMGDFTLNVGLFSANWDTLYQWKNAVVSLRVSLEAAQQLISIYDETIGYKWKNWSWDTAINFSALTPSPIDGIYSARVAFETPWAGLYFHRDPKSTEGKTNIGFFISGGDVAGQQLKITSYDAQNKAVKTVPLANYLPEKALVNGWRGVEVPLTDLGIFNTEFTGISFQGATGKIEQPFYIDALRLQDETSQ